MTLSNYLIGLPAMLLCLILQVAVAFWCVRYYIRQAADGPAQPGFLAGIRPLLVAMLVMMVGNFLQIALWGALFLWLGEFGNSTRRSTTRPSILPRSVTATSS